MITVALYRQVVPEHTEDIVSNDTVTLWLGIAVSRHTASEWGQMYSYALCWWAAHRIATQPDYTGPGAVNAGAAGPLTSQRDGDLSRTYAQPGSSGGVTDGSDADYQRTSWGRLYLDTRNSRAASAPFFVF